MSKKFKPMTDGYVPYLDDTLASTLGPVKYIEDEALDNQRVALSKYVDAQRLKTYPYFTQYGVPLTYQIKQKIKAKAEAKGQSLSKGKLYSRLFRKLVKGGAGPADIAAAKQKAKSALAREEPAVKANAKAKMNKAILQSWVRRGYGIGARGIGARGVKPTGAPSSGKPSKLGESAAFKTGVLQDTLETKIWPTTIGNGLSDKIRKYMALSKAGDPMAKIKLAQYRAQLKASGAGYVRARPAGGKCAAKATMTSGGAVGLAALASAAVPFILEGVEWLGKKIKDKVAARRARKAALEAASTSNATVAKAAGLPPNQALASPRNGMDLWKQLYKIVENKLIALYPGDGRVKELAKEFVRKHQQAVFTDVGKAKANFKNASASSTPTAGTGLSVYDVIHPLCVGHPADDSLTDLPQLQVPCGGDFMESIFSVLKNKELQSTAIAATKTLLQELAKRLSHANKSNLLAKTNAVTLAPDSASQKSDMSSSSSALDAEIAQSSEENIIENKGMQPPAAPTITEPVFNQATPKFQSNATSYTPQGLGKNNRYNKKAKRVYGMAKKMP